MLSSQVVPVAKTAEVQTRGQGTRAKMSSSPLESQGQKIIPSVTRFFTEQQILYVFFQAYYPAKGEKSESVDPAALRGGLVFFREGLEVNATPLLAPSEIDQKNHIASFRMSLPLAKLPPGRYAVEALAVAPGTQHSAFGRAYLALQAAPSPSTGVAPPVDSQPAGQAKSPLR
jgi:hypothetical protein